MNLDETWDGRKRLTGFVFMAVILAFLAVSCGGGSSDGGATPAAAEQTQSFLMIVHASPGAPAVDYFVDSSKLNTAPLEYPNNTGYLALDPGSHNVRIDVTGTTTTFVDETDDYARGQYYTIFTTGILTAVSPLRLTDDLTAPAAGNANLRFVHLSPDAPPVDVTKSDGTVIFGNKSFRESTPFTPLPAGTYDLQIRLAGTSVVVLDVPGVVLENGKIYTIFAKGLIGVSGTQAIGAQLIVNK